MSAAELADAITRIDAEPVYIARALDHELRAALAGVLEFEELPFVRGRTVVPEDLGDRALVIAGHPNSLGVFDLPPTPRWIAVTGSWSSLAAAEGAIEEVAMAPPVDADDARRALAATIALGKQLGQLRGVTAAFRPSSPILVVLLTVDPERVADLMALTGWDALTGYEELPGGLRIAPDPIAPAHPSPGYAQALEAAIEQVRLSQEE